MKHASAIRESPATAEHVPEHAAARRLVLRARREPSLQAILPPGATCSEQLGTLWGELLPEEAALLTRRMVPSRQLELVAGRTCARAALAALGFPAEAILRGPQREPLWPAGISGSITHTGGYCAAAVARTEECAALGIDVEPNRHLPRRVLKTIANERELQWIAGEGPDTLCRDRLLFSIKESVFKTWFPLERCWLDFLEAEVDVDLHAHTFQATILRASSVCPGVIEGRFQASTSLILTCASVPGRAGL